MGHLVYAVRRDYRYIRNLTGRRICLEKDTQPSIEEEAAQAFRHLNANVRNALNDRLEPRGLQYRLAQWKLPGLVTNFRPDRPKPFLKNLKAVRFDTIVLVTAAVRESGDVYVQP